MKFGPYNLGEHIHKLPSHLCVVDKWINLELCESDVELILHLSPLLASIKEMFNAANVMLKVSLE